jgi:high-affinity Fe2+/Pb2+ permease
MMNHEQILCAYTALFSAFVFFYTVVLLLCFERVASSVHELAKSGHAVIT